MKPARDKKPKGYWTLERCREVWLTCPSIQDFCKKHNSVYQYVYRNGWKDEMRKDFPLTKKQTGYWTLGRCREAWRSCGTISEFQKIHSSASTIVYRNGWVDEMHKDFPNAQKKSFWTKLQNCRAAWRSCSSIVEFQEKYSSANTAVYLHGWVDEMRKDFLDAKPPNGYWTLQRCRGAWLSCASITQFLDQYPGAYGSVTKNGWVEVMHQDLEPSYIASAFDIAYLWKTDLTYQGRAVYKFGSTSKRRGEKRIKEVAKRNSTSHTILRFVECKKSHQIEASIKKAVSLVHGLSGDGATEMFTVSSVAELNWILDLFDRLIIEQSKL